MQIENIVENTDENMPCHSSLQTISPLIDTSPEATSLKQCAGCSMVITDALVLLVENQYWHGSCLKCNACSKQLENTNSCFIKNGRFYCRNDYFDLFIQQKCASCNVHIPSHEYVRRVHDKVYHNNQRCFSCFMCKRHLVSGENFIQDCNRLICWLCLQTNLENSECFHLSPGNKNCSNRKRKSSLKTSQLDSISGGVDINFSHENLSSDIERVNYNPSKHKRMRTSFKHDQLCTMKNYFATNQNPDSKALNDLGQETGLTKRVLQVWFQNARAKFRRSAAKDESDQSGKKIDKNTAEIVSESNCSDSFSSANETSPESATYSYETKSHSDDIDVAIIKSIEDYPSFYCQPNFVNSFQPPLYLPSMASLQNSSSPTSSLTSEVETTLINSSSN